MKTTKTLNFAEYIRIQVKIIVAYLELGESRRRKSRRNLGKSEEDDYATFL